MEILLVFKMNQPLVPIGAYLDKQAPFSPFQCHHGERERPETPGSFPSCRGLFTGNAGDRRLRLADSETDIGPLALCTADNSPRIDGKPPKPGDKGGDTGGFWSSDKAQGTERPTPGTVGSVVGIGDRPPGHVGTTPYTGPPKRDSGGT